MEVSNREWNINEIHSLVWVVGTLYIYINRCFNMFSDMPYETSMSNPVHIFLNGDWLFSVFIKPTVRILCVYHGLINDISHLKTSCAPIHLSNSLFKNISP